MTGPIRVLVADDQRVVREGLGTLLGLIAGIEVVGTAADGNEALALAVKLRPDVVLMDLRMPRCDGIEATRRLREHDAGIKVLVLTTYADDRSAIDALRAGARGYLTKDAGAMEIRQALEQVTAGQPAIDPAVQQHLLDVITASEPRDNPEPAPQFPGGLTAREAEVLALIARGLSNSEIAGRLMVSETTVKSHINHLFAKTGVRPGAGSHLRLPARTHLRSAVTIPERVGRSVGHVSMAPGKRAAQAAAVAFGVFTLAVGLASVPLDATARQPGPNGLAALAFVALVMVPAVAVGTLLAARRPRNPIGWLLLGIFLLAVAPAGAYAIIDYRLHHGTLPLGSVAVVLLTSFPVWLVLIAIMLWVFPDGVLPAGRWRRVSVILVTAGVLLALAATVAGAASVAGHAVVVDATGNLANTTTGLTVALQGITVIGALASVVAWLAVQVPRYRRASHERRQQLKWLYSGATVFVVSLFLAVFTSDSASTWDLAVNDVISPIGFAVLPVCTGVAVLKYRLYAIDRIISRVISYAVISAVLAGLFAGLVLVATPVVQVHTPVGVAVATLAAAALFNPLRRRVQRAVDRRFNRSRYNAEAVIAGFTARLRGTVDLDAVRDDLAAAVDQAFEPVHVSVWLPGPGHAR